MSTSWKPMPMVLKMSLLRRSPSARTVPQLRRHLHLWIRENGPINASPNKSLLFFLYLAGLYIVSVPHLFVQLNPCLLQWILDTNISLRSTLHLVVLLIKVLVNGFPPHLSKKKLPSSYNMSWLTQQNMVNITTVVTPCINQHYRIRSSVKARLIAPHGKISHGPSRPQFFDSFSGLSNRPVLCILFLFID